MHELSVLVVNPNDRGGRLAQLLQERFAQDVTCSRLEFALNLHKAITKLQEGSFHLCFISHRFEEEELKSFFIDVEKLGEQGWCAYVQVHPVVPEEFPVQQMYSLGFHGVLSEQGNHRDREELKSAIQKWKDSEHELRTKIDIQSAINVLLKKIDDAASNLKRGFVSKIDNVPSEFIELKSQNDEEVFEVYIRKLTSRTDEAEPENADTVAIPDEILAKNLPKLEKNKYTGASTRVWRLLLRTHGVVEEGEKHASEKEEEPSEEQLSSESPPAEIK